MLALGAVKPDRHRVVDHHGVCGDLSRPFRYLLEAGKEASYVRHDAVDGRARVCECGLRDGVILREI